MTKKFYLSTALLLSVLMFTAIAQAGSEDPIVTFSGDFDKIIQSNGYAEFDIIIHNNDADRSIDLSLTNLYGWLTNLSKDELVLDKGEEASVHINITPPADVEVKTYKFNLDLKNAEALIGTVELKVSIGEDASPIVFESGNFAETAYPGQDYPFSFTLLNNAYDPELSVKLVVNSLIFESPFITTKNFDRKETKTISESVKIKPYLTAGTYNVEIRATDGKEYSIYSKSITIPNTGSMVITEESNYGLLKSTHKVIISNPSKYALEDQYVLELNGLSRLFTYISPDPVSSDGGRYHFEVSLASGASMTITYTVSYFPLIIAFVAMAGFLFWFYSRKRCSITKHVSPSADKLIKVTLTLKNKSARTLNNLLVSDNVPSSLQVVRDSGMVPDVSTKLTASTKLTWKIPKLAPHEERYISYKVKPLIRIVGRMSLPPAAVYVSAKDKATSNSASIKSR